MATTSPDNIRTPDSGDSYALVQDMGILADTVQNALIKRANAYVGTVAQRTAFESSAPTGTIWSDTDGGRLVWKKGATEWVPVFEVPPRREAFGSRAITLSVSSGSSVTVNFPSGVFSQAPLVFITKQGSTLAKYVPYANNVTSTSFTLGIYSGDGTQLSGTVNLAWHAIQP